MKIVKLVLAVALVTGLLVGALGCTKVTGGGKLDDGYASWSEAVAGEEWGWWQSGLHKVTFGFNAQPEGERRIIYDLGSDGVYYEQDVKGQLQLIDHDLKWKLHGEFTTMGGFDPPNPEESGDLRGTCTVDGVPGTFYAKFYDYGEPGPNNGDRLYISAYSNDREYVFVPGYGWYWMSKWEYYVDGIIDGGNIQLHKK